MNFDEFKKCITNATAEIVDVTTFDNKLINMIKDKEVEFGIILAIQDEDGRVGSLLQGKITGTLYVEYIEAGDLFRL